MTLRCFKYFEKLFKNSLLYRSEITCSQAFFALRNNKKLYQQYKIKLLLLTALTQSNTRQPETPKGAMGLMAHQIHLSHLVHFI